MNIGMDFVVAIILIAVLVFTGVRIRAYCIAYAKKQGVVAQAAREQNRKVWDELTNYTDVRDLRKKAQRKYYTQSYFDHASTSKRK